ncbi:3-methyladenine DNA glycosylase [Cellulomonas sp. PhB143]|uniref:3-methyladenine DNA glycosylase n=1 Tax=Cellulomonas sp. PhB143 TaxID=2485186 RepID=UPI000FA9AD36|nr:3-methyladenine DNA glycosylase [Cellulomonas sp. PhB143]ROS73539.1 hypothetical protein EDF32_2388 [Cellulomonas sp. PhB143]
MPTTTVREILSASAWSALAAAHAARADALTAVWRAAHERGEKHAIEDFLFTYYPTRPGQLRRWHPGPGVVVLSPDPAGRVPDDVARAAYAERTSWRWYRKTTVEVGGRPRAGVVLDTAALLAERGPTLEHVRTLLANTAGRPARLGCFGLHEWAMVYRDRERGRDQRHPLPLRLGHAGTDAVVEAHPITCTHFDAFRFFTPEARGLNRLQPTRESQPAMEQPGCLHATMDLYKWATKLAPAVPGDLLLDCFELARDVRHVDMRASPYDVSSYGEEAVAIETPAGRAEYVRHQRAFAERGQALRARLLATVDALLTDEPVAGAAAAAAAAAEQAPAVVPA